ncbi:methylated-DNA--[protein]-cysteine S-methyltransferase [Aeromonas diversa]|uniref:methylated-DNA--[protein]-cysteine S-methyltransferase n=1 Tax=Aeromonas diversa TaxID=502790 RepID=UPI0034637C81
MHYAFCQTVRGPLLVAIDRDGLRHVEFCDGERPQPVLPDWRHDEVALRPYLEQFTAYFSGRLTRFDLPLAACGTAFQMAVWAALREIPFGHTVSYRDIANAIGNPKAVRAVGAANGRNPLSVIVPCHRVIGSAGALTGYAGGLPIKAWLLEHEKSVAKMNSR